MTDSIASTLKQELDETMFGGMSFDERMKQRVRTSVASHRPAGRMRWSLWSKGLALAAVFCLSIGLTYMYWPRGVEQPPLPPGSDISCSPVLSTGTLQEAVAALGFTILQPAYIPPGWSQEKTVQWDLRASILTFTKGDNQFVLFQLPMTEAEYKEFTLAQEDELPPTMITVAGVQAFALELQPEPGDSNPGAFDLGWYKDGFSFALRGDLSMKGELLKVAESLIK